MVSAFDKSSGKTPLNKEIPSQNTENWGAQASEIKAEDASVKAGSPNAKTVPATSIRAQKVAAKAAAKATTAGAGSPITNIPKMSTPKSTSSKTSTPRRSLVSASPTRPAAGITFAELHGDFLRARRVEGIRPTTLRTYRGSLHPWSKWCAASGVDFVGQVLTKHAENYLLLPQDRKLSERTIRNQAIVIKAALKFAFQQGHLASKRLYSWKIPRMSRASVYMPDHAEVGIILDAIPQHWSAAQNPLSRFRNASASTFFSWRADPQTERRRPPGRVGRALLP